MNFVRKSKKNDDFLYLLWIENYYLVLYNNIWKIIKMLKIKVIMHRE